MRQRRRPGAPAPGRALATEPRGESAGLGARAMRGRGMSGKIMGLVLRWYAGIGGELMTAVAIGDNASDDGENIYPAIADIGAHAPVRAQCAAASAAHGRQRIPALR